MIRTTAFALVVLTAACGGKSRPPATTGGGPAGAAVVVTLKELQAGDRACYVIVENEVGEQSIEGDFELCAGGSRDATALIGKPVTYTTERANVQAASCQGAPDCSDSDEVDLVVTITAAP